MRSFSCLLIVLSLFQARISGIAHSATISGTVTRDDPPVPAARVVVRIATDYGARMESGGELVRTDDQGHFEVKGYPAGEHHVALSTGNFIEGGAYVAYYCAERIKQQFVSADDADPPPLSFHLELGTSVKGQAITAGGQPLNVGFAMVEGGMSGFKIERDGTFLVSGVPRIRNNYRINIFPANAAHKEYAYTRFVDVDARRLKPGGVIDVGVIRFASLPKENNLLGTATGADGKPLKGAIVYLAVLATDHISQPIGVVDGKIEQPMISGKWNLYAGADWARYVTTFEVKNDGITEVQIQDRGVINDPPAEK
ncbi:hypothetical protein BH09PLA1_BH09PLA1_26960 [soil metagenome]